MHRFGVAILSAVVGLYLLVGPARAGDGGCARR